MPIEFSASQRSTLGIEWELALVDSESFELVNVADSIIARVSHRDDTVFPHVTHELLQNTVELVTAPHHRVNAALTELASLVREVRDITDPMGLSLMCAGAHPFSLWADQVITDSARYSRFVERTQWWGRNMLIWGVHVHIGMDAREKVFPVMHALLAYLPHLQALAASSPFWAGETTGYASNRALMFQQLPTAGLPFDLNDWEEFERYIGDAQSAEIIEQVDEVRWDIRPSPKWGTLELRYCDGLSTLTEIGAVAALSQCLAESFSRDLDAGLALPRLQPWFVRENKWRSARYGLDATVIVDTSGRQRSLRDEIRTTVDRLMPVAVELDCAKELGWVLNILESGASYERQLRVAASHGGDLRTVARSLVGELAASID